MALPEDYHANDDRYPVVYLLDGDTLFGMAASLTTAAGWAQEAPELIVVGIGYGVEGYEQWTQLRELDLALPGATSHDVSDPTNSPQPDLFLRTLREDIVPYVDRNYRTQPDDRCLYGYSWGGFFVLYALLHQPDAFQRYISGSGLLEHTTDYVCRQAGLLHNWHSVLDARVYISVGEREADQVIALPALVRLLANAQRPNIELSTEIYPNEGHSPVGIALTYLHGMRAVFSRTA